MKLSRKHIDIFNSLNNINNSLDRKKLQKILRYLNKNLLINDEDIEYLETIHGNQFDFIPSFSVFHKKMIHNEKNILLVVNFLDKIKADIKYMSNMSKDYFVNFDNLYFTLFFDADLKPYLFMKNEHEYETDIILIDDKNIKPFL